MSAISEKTITALIECPKGYNQKFDYEPETQRFRLSKILPAGLVFPFDFGMIPGTKGEDGDPLDIIVISESGTFLGCLIDCRVIGALKAEQTERNGDTVRNDRFIGIPEVSQLFSAITTLAELPEAILSQLEAFFKNYNEQAGKEFKVTARLTAGQAAKLLA
ncbi:inorganic diphosphatase [Mucilaginibacter sp. UR6-11]|uniref:inorganic diphosphatase n=1 Tax=Mucilaginibacter sp. UR6-11 TaxID=1435644 RepID=UPI001E64EE8C|nr:inorganic diphosphatase [Mucilaginibacter sp. UR6-11]MCC8424735.1 inorganic diphosphatase [Mucilaginibacter sp. UR6-11]